MARRRSDDIYLQTEGKEKVSDPADKAFWDEFWMQENSGYEDDPLVTIVIKNHDTGEEKVVENVRLRFRSSQVLKDN